MCFYASFIYLYPSLLSANAVLLGIYIYIYGWLPNRVARPPRQACRGIKKGMANIWRSGPNNPKMVRITHPSRAEPSQAEPGRAIRAEPSRASPSRAEPSRDGTGRASPSRSEPSRAKPSRFEPSRAKPSQAEPNRRRPTRHMVQKHNVLQ